MIKSIVLKKNSTLNPEEVKLYTNDNKMWDSENYSIQFGNKKAKIQLSIRSSHNNEENLEISTSIFNLLNIPIENMRINIEVNKKKQKIIIGPLIGVFIRRRRKKKNISASQRRVIEHYLKQAKSMNYLAFAFSAEDINWKNKHIQGYVIDNNNEIIKKTIPFPDVMYDQNSSRTYEKLPHVVKALQRLHNIIPQYFNPGYLDKWEIYDYISSHDIAKRYQPPTRLLEDVTHVASEVEKYGTVYIKPVNGSQGKGIITVEKNNNFYEYKYQGNTLIEGRCKNKIKLEEFIINTVKKRKYIIQRGLSLVKHNGSPIDIRVLMQKNDKGRWIRTKMFARISKPGTIISNLSLGGEAKTIDEALTESFSKSVLATIKKKLITASKIIPKALEEQSEQHFGELGLDIGVTKNGEIWLIEINSKPWKAVETTVGSDDLVEKSFRRPIEYAGFLANYGMKKEV